MVRKRMKEEINKAEMKIEEFEVLGKNRKQLSLTPLGAASVTGLKTVCWVKMEQVENNGHMKQGVRGVTDCIGETARNTFTHGKEYDHVLINSRENTYRDIQEPQEKH